MAQSCPCVISDLDLWSVPFEQYGIQESIYDEIRPNSSTENQDTFEFVAVGSDNYYLDPSNSFLFVEFEVRKADGSTTASTEKVALANNVLNSGFQQVDCWLNETLITKNSNLYGYKAYLEDLLSHGIEAQNSYLTAQGFLKQESGKFENTSDSSFTARHNATTGGKKFQCMGRLHLDICQQTRLIPNNVDMKIKLIKSSNQWTLFKETSDTENYKFKISDIAFYIRRVRLSDDIRLNHIERFEAEPAIYPHKHVEMKAITIPSSISDWTADKLFEGPLPNKLFFALSSNAAFNGSYTKNPFKFDNHGVNHIALYIDGKQIPADPMTPDYTNKRYCRPFLSLIEATGTLNTPFGINLKYKEFLNDNNIYGFDLTPHLSQGNSITRRKGAIRLALKFASSLNNALTLIVYGEFDSNLLIDKARNILPFQ